MNGFLTSLEKELQLKQQLLSKSRQQTNIEIMNILNFAINFKFDLHIILLLVSVWADFDSMLHKLSTDPPRVFITIEKSRTEWMNALI